jgi:hypothetical protein
MFDVSAGAIILVVSAGVIIVSTGATVAVSVAVDESELLLQAAKAPIAKTINSFFILFVFFVM